MFMGPGLGVKWKWKRGGRLLGLLEVAGAFAVDLITAFAAVLTVVGGGGEDM